MPPDGGHAESVADFVDRGPATGEFKDHRGSEALVRASVVDACYASAEAEREIKLG